MLLKGMRKSILGLAAWALASGAYAEGPKVGGEFRAGLSYNDGKLKETKAEPASATTDIGLYSAKLLATGDQGNGVSYMLRYHLTSTDHSQAIEHAWAKLEVANMLHFKLGRSKVNQGGWHVMDEWAEYHNTETHAAFGYAGSMPIATFTDMISLSMDLAGSVELQLFDDVMYKEEVATAAQSVAKNESNKGPAASIQWVGDFSGWKPLVQIVNYDLGKSLAYSVGIKGMVADLDLMLNYTADNRKDHRISGTKSDPKDLTFTQIDAKFGYDLGGWKPWLAFHQFNRDDKYAADKDRDYNKSEHSFDDNAQSIVLGVECHAFKQQHYVPYLTLNMDSAAVEDDENPGKAETRQENTLNVGVYASF